MKRIYNAIIVSGIILFFLSGCMEETKGTDKGVECRLYWIDDSKDADGCCDYRLISLHYIIINNTTEEYFLPIKSCIPLKGDSAYCSRMIATINKKPIDTWFETDTRWNSVLKPADSIRASLKIPERLLDSANVSKSINSTELLGLIDVNYIKCLSDTSFCSKPIPPLIFTKNDTIAIPTLENKINQ